MHTTGALSPCAVRRGHHLWVQQVRPVEGRTLQSHRRAAEGLGAPCGPFPLTGMPYQERWALRGQVKAEAHPAEIAPLVERPLRSTMDGANDHHPDGHVMRASIKNTGSPAQH